MRINHCCLVFRITDDVKTFFLLLVLLLLFVYLFEANIYGWQQIAIIWVLEGNAWKWWLVKMQYFCNRLCCSTRRRGGPSDVYSFHLRAYLRHYRHRFVLLFNGPARGTTHIFNNAITINPISSIYSSRLPQNMFCIQIHRWFQFIDPRLSPNDKHEPKKKLITKILVIKMLCILL